MSHKPTLAELGVLIRAAIPEDQPAINDLEIAVHKAGEGIIYTLEELQNAMAKGPPRIPPLGDGVMMLSIADDTIVGQAAIRRRPLASMLHVAGIDISIHPDWQGKGIGRELMNRILEWGVDPANDLLRMELQVRGDNPRAINLYESLGFQHEGRRKRFFQFKPGEFVDDVLMARFC